MDKTIVVGADENLIINRGFSRDGMSESEIKDRLQYQIPLKEKIKLADYYIDNSGSLDNTKRQVLEIWNILKKKIRT
jgi:dephospho-CoA kinase